MSESSETRVITRKETAAVIRKKLRAAFPGHKISVTCERGSSYIHATWVDGPTVRQVDDIVAGFRDEVFDMQTDTYRQLPDREVIPTPGAAPERIRYSCSGVLTQRWDSIDAVRETATAILTENPHLLYGHPMPDFSAETVGNIVHAMTHDYRHTTNQAITYKGRSVGMEIRYLDNAADVLRYCLGTTERLASN